MPNSTFSKKIGKSLLVKQDNILGLKGANVSSMVQFTLQFFVTGNDSALDNLITLVVSNDGINWTEIIPGTTVFPYSVSVNVVEPGTKTYFLSVGPAEGIASVNFINFNYSPNAVPPTAGTIDTVIICGHSD